MRIVTLSLAAAVALTPAAVIASGKTAAPSYTLSNTTYSQDFDGLASTGSSNTALPAGFQIVETGTASRADGEYEAGTGSSNAGNTYSFGNSSDRALGSLTSGSASPIYFGGIFTNGLGATIDSLTFGYDGEQWRSGSAGFDALNFQFSLNATELDNGTWTDFDLLDFAATNFSGSGAINGNTFSTAISGTIGGLSIADGSRFGFRWVDEDVSGSDHGLGVDNLTIAASVLPVAGAVPEPSAWALMILGFGMVGLGLRSRRRVAFA